MASEQARRENVVKEREVKVEKDKVPKTTSSFEPVAEKSKDSATQSHQETKMKRTQMPQSVGKFLVISGDEKETGEKEGQERASLEDIHGAIGPQNFRAGTGANAQQKSMDTIRTAEERYNKAKESMGHGGQEGRGEGRGSGVHATHVAKERGPHGAGEATDVFGQEGPGRVGVELTGGGREELESGAHGFHGEKARHAQLLAAGGQEIKEKRDQESAGGGGRSRTDYMGHEHGDR